MQNLIDCENDSICGYHLPGSSSTQISAFNDEPDLLNPMLEGFQQNAFNCPETTEQEQEWRADSVPLFPQYETTELEDSGNHGRSEENAFNLPSFATTFRRQNHSSTDYLETESLQCHITTEKVSSQYSLNGNSGYEKRATQHECETCKKRFRWKSWLQRHERIHTSVERPYECQICKKGFTGRNNLKRHVLGHTGERPHKCDMCAKAFCTKSLLKSHQLVHTREKPYECEICKKSFRKKSDLERHIYTHTGEKPFECEICKKQFTRKDPLTDHRFAHHSKELRL